MRDCDAIEVLKGLGGLAQGEAEVHMQGQAQGHHMGVELAELQGRGMLWQGVQSHLEEVHCELAVDVVELVLVLAIAFSQVFLIDFLEVVQVVGALGVDAFVEDEVLPVLFRDQGMAAVGAAQLHGGEAAVLRGEPCIAYLAENLAFGAVVPVEVWHGRVAAGAGAVLGDIAFRAAVHGPDLLPIALFDIGDELPVGPSLSEVGDEGQFVCLEFLVFGGMGIIESPLSEWDVSADEHDQPAVLLVKVLNKL